ncbi:MAG TPA: IS630 transposase-related protein [Candidatus Sericytochromatia bacterium]
MAKAYSYDFRQKVLQALALNGLKKSEVSQLFPISRNTLDLWLKRKAATGNVQAKQRPAVSPRQRSTDWEKFRAFAKEHESKTQVELAALWERDISDRTLARALAKLGWTRKQRRTGIANAMRANGQRS